jgi:hypothetical protein
VATDQDQFGRAAYERAVELYRAVEVLRLAVEAAGGEPHLARVRRIGTGVVGLRERAVAVLREAAALGGPGAVELAAAGFAPEVVAAVAAPTGPGAGRATTVPLGLPVFVLGPAGGDMETADGVPAAPCGSCR